MAAGASDTNAVWHVRGETGDRRRDSPLVVLGLVCGAEMSTRTQLVLPKSVSDYNPENWVSGGPLPGLAECLREMDSRFLLVRSEGEPERAGAMV